MKKSTTEKLLIIFIVFAVISGFIFIYLNFFNKNYIISKKLDINISLNAEIIKYEHNAYFQDWDTYAIFQLNNKQLEKTINSIENSKKNWQKLPIKSSQFSINCNNCNNGYYFDYKTKNTDLVISAILDTDSKLLYFKEIKF